MSTRAEDDDRHDRTEKGVEVMWPLMPTLWNVTLQHACARTTRSGQRSALTRVNVSKGVAHRAENPGGQYAHTVQAVLGQQDSMSRDLHADHRAAEQPTAALFAPWPSVTVFTAGGGLGVHLYQ